MNATPDILPPRDPDQARAIGFDPMPREDGAVEAELRGRMREETGIDPHSLTLTVTGGTVVFEGDADGRTVQRRLVDWALGIPGVKAVINRTLLLDREAEVLRDEHLQPDYGGLVEVSGPMPEFARRCGEAT
jgi:hypothetical protein